MGYSLVKYGSFRVSALLYKKGSWSCAQPGLTFKQEHVYVLVVYESEKSNQFMSAVFSKPVVLRTKAVQQEWNSCIVRWIRLSVRFNWRNFALALATRISIAEFLHNFRLTSGA